MILKGSLQLVKLALFGTKQENKCMELLGEYVY